MKTLWKSLLGVTVGAMLLAGVQVQAVQGDAAEGGKLYAQKCASCHKDKPGKMMGKPVDALVASMKKYKALACPGEKQAKMQAAVKPLSDQQLTDISVYLNGLK